MDVVFPDHTHLLFLVRYRGSYIPAYLLFSLLYELKNMD